MSDPNEHTSAFKIWKYFFRIRVPSMYTRSSAHLRNRPSITTGDPVADRKMALEMTEIRCTIRNMVEYRAEGAQLELVDPKDSMTIYEILMDFLDQQNAAYQFSHNYGLGNNEKLELIRDLDDLAKEVYQVALKYYPNHLQERSTLGLFERKPDLGLKGKSKVKYNLKREHKSVSDMISTKALERTKSWQ